MVIVFVWTDIMTMAPILLVNHAILYVLLALEQVIVAKVVTLLLSIDKLTQTCSLAIACRDILKSLVNSPVEHVTTHVRIVMPVVSSLVPHVQALPTSVLALGQH